MKKYPVVDTHYHLGINAGRCSNEKDMFKWLDEGGIDIQFIMQPNEGSTYRSPDWNPCLGNDYIANVQKKNPERIMGLATVFPWWQPPRIYMHGPKQGRPFDRVTRNPAVEEVERSIGELGLWGLKVHPLEHHHQINNPYIMYPLYEKMVEMQTKTGRNLMVFIHAAGDDIGNTPEAVYMAAREFPKLLFVAAHSGYYHASPTVGSTMAQLNNVMLDLTTVAIPATLVDVYRQFGAKKFCAGSDGPVASVTVKNSIVNSLTEDIEERALIQGGNLMKYFNIKW